MCQLTASLDTRHRLLLTGTPLQNTVSPSLSICEERCTSNCKAAVHVSPLGLTYVYHGVQISCPEANNRRQKKASEVAVGKHSSAKITQEGTCQKPRNDTHVFYFCVHLFPQVDELFNLLQFIEPGKFSDKAFFMQQFTNLEREGQVRGRRHGGKRDIQAFLPHAGDMRMLVRTSSAAYFWEPARTLSRLHLGYDCLFCHVYACNQGGCIACVMSHAVKI